MQVGQGQPSPGLARSSSHLAQPAARWLADHELWSLAIAAPFLLFPNRGTPLALPLLLLPWLSRWLTTGRFSLRTSSDPAILVLLLMALVGLIPSVALQLSLSRLWIIFLGVALFYGMVNNLKREAHLLRASWALVLVGLAVALLGLVGTDWEVGQLIEVPQLYQRLPTLIRDLPGRGLTSRESGLINPREIGGTMALLLPVSLALLAHTHGQRQRVLAGSITAVLGGTLLLTQSPTALLGVAAALVLFAGMRSRWALLLYLPLLLLLLASIPPLWERGMRYPLPEEDRAGFAVAARLGIWSSAISMVQDMPFTGIGLNTFPYIMDSYYPAPLLGREPHAHNLFLHTAVDLGISGLVAFFWILIAFARNVGRGLKATSREVRGLFLGLAGGVLAYLVFGMSDVFTFGVPEAVFWAMLGVASAGAIAGYGPSADSPPAPVARGRRRWLSLILAGGTAALALPLALSALYVNLGALELHKEGGISPRRSQAVILSQPYGEESFKEALRWYPANRRERELLMWTQSLQPPAHAQSLGLWCGKTGPDALKQARYREMVSRSSALASREAWAIM